MTQRRWLLLLGGGAALGSRSAYSLIDTADRQAATLAVSAVVLTERTTAAGYVSAVLAAGTIAEAQTAAAPYLAL